MQHINKQSKKINCIKEILWSFNSFYTQHLRTLCYCWIKDNNNFKKGRIIWFCYSAYRIHTKKNCRYYKYGTYTALLETGKSIKENILQNKRAGYGEEVMSTLSKRLTEKYGKGWSAQQLRHCLRSAETFFKTQILSAVRRKLSWTRSLCGTCYSCVFPCYAHLPCC